MSCHENHDNLLGAGHLTGVQSHFQDIVVSPPPVATPQLVHFPMQTIRARAPSSSIRKTGFDSTRHGDVKLHEPTAPSTRTKSYVLVQPYSMAHPTQVPAVRSAATRTSYISSPAITHVANAPCCCSVIDSSHYSDGPPTLNCKDVSRGSRQHNASTKESRSTRTRAHRLSPPELASPDPSYRLAECSVKLAAMPCNRGFGEPRRQGRGRCHLIHTSRRTYHGITSTEYVLVRACAAANTDTLPCALRALSGLPRRYCVHSGRALIIFAYRASPTCRIACRSRSRASVRPVWAYLPCLNASWPGRSSHTNS